MNIEVKKNEFGKDKHLHVAGEIDAYTSPKLRDEIIPLTEGEGNQVTVDLTHVHYIDSTGLGIFIGALKSANAHHSFLKLTGLNQRIKRLFSITGLDEVLDIEEGKREEAKR